MVPGLNYFSLAQSHQVLEGKENFWDDYGCGVAVPVGKANAHGRRTKLVRGGRELDFSIEIAEEDRPRRSRAPRPLSSGRTVPLP